MDAPRSVSHADTRIFELLETHARRDASADAILAPDRPCLSYGGLVAHLQDVAELLRGSGVTAGDRVALVLPAGPELLTAVLAVAECAAAAPINPLLRQQEFEAYMAAVGVTRLIAAAGGDTAAVRAASVLGVPVTFLSTCSAEPAGIFRLDSAVTRRVSDVPTRADEVALLLTTSGTTSTPRVVPLTHRSLRASAVDIAASLHLRTTDRCLDLMPLFHVHGLVGGALSSLVAGAGVICPSGFDAPRFFDQIDQCRATWYTAVPTMHQAIVGRAPGYRAAITRSALRLIRSCSAALPPQTRADLEREFRVPVVEAYGMTEAAHQISSTPLPVDSRKAGSVGVAISTAVAILDQTGVQLPHGQSGEIAIRGECVTSGYLDAPEANRRAFVDGWLRTGDVGHLDQDGYLFITGRLKEFINRAGEKIAPAEVDAALLLHPSVEHAVAFALPDASLGEAVAAAVVLRSGARCSERELREFVATELADFKVPVQIVFVDEIPRGATGKVQRLGLAERLGVVRRPSPAPLAPGVVARARESGAASSFVQRVVSAIWSDVLRVADIGEHDSFFELGGDSILAAQILSRVRDMLHVELSFVFLFDKPTIAAMSLEIETARERLPATQPVDTPTSEASEP